MKPRTLFTVACCSASGIPITTATGRPTFEEGRGSQRVADPRHPGKTGGQGRRGTPVLQEATRLKAGLRAVYVDVLVGLRLELLNETWSSGSGGRSRPRTRSMMSGASSASSGRLIIRPMQTSSTLGRTTASLPSHPAEIRPVSVRLGRLPWRSMKKARKAIHRPAERFRRADEAAAFSTKWPSCSKKQWASFSTRPGVARADVQARRGACLRFRASRGRYAGPINPQSRRPLPTLLKDVGGQGISMDSM